MKSNKTNGKTWGCLGLFALPFAGVGVFMIGLIGVKLAQWAAMQYWHETPAKILSAELEHHDDSDGGTTYRAVAEYEYEFAGAAYRSTRVALHGGSDNIGSYQKRIGRELVKHANNGEPFRCFVDPRQPDQAVLYRDLRFEMIAFYDVFAVIFGGVGFGLLLGGLYARPIARREEELQSRFPHEPWKWKSEWIDGRIPSSQKTFFALALAAAWWNTVSLPTTLLLPLEIVHKHYWALVALVFPGVGLLLLHLTWRTWTRRQRFGQSTLQLAATPGVVGGQLAGVLHIPRHIEPLDGFHQKLICEETVKSDDGSTTRIVWDDERTFTTEMLSRDRSQTAVPVLFAIPYESRPSDAQSNAVRWKLRIKAKLPGVDYREEFEVPVFKTAESSPDFKLDESLIQDYVQPADLEDALRKAGIRLEENAWGKTSLVFPMARNVGMSLGLSVFCTVWCGATFAAVKFGAPWFVQLTLGVFALLIGWATADSWFYYGRIDDRKSELAFRGGWFGLGRERRVDKSEVQSVTVQQSAQSGNRVYFNLQLCTESGKKNMLARNLPGKRLADRVKEQVGEMLTS